MAQRTRHRPWLYGILHDSGSLDDVLKAYFGLRGEWPHVEDRDLRNRLEGASNCLFGFLYAQVHQNQHVVDETERREPGFHLAARDLADETVHEILAACLLARVGAIPQGIAHVRRSMEVALDAVAYAGVDQAPNLQLPGEVAGAVVGGKLGARILDATFQDLHDQTSRFVHVARAARGHEPGFDAWAVSEWAETTSLLTSWMSRVFRVLWRHLGLDRPGLAEWMDRVGHDYSVTDWSQPEGKLSVCRLTDGATP